MTPLPIVKTSACRQKEIQRGGEMFDSGKSQYCDFLRPTTSFKKGAIFQQKKIQKIFPAR